MKYMNRITLYVSLCMLALFCSCDEERDIRWTTVEIDVQYPSDLSGISKYYVGYGYQFYDP